MYAINFRNFQKFTNNTKINRLQKFPGLQYAIFTEDFCQYIFYKNGQIANRS